MEKNMMMSISMNVEGTEGMNIKLDYVKTDLKTVVMVQKALLKMFDGILSEQEKQLR